MGQVIMLGTLFGLMALVVGLVLHFDPEARPTESGAPSREARPTESGAPESEREP